MLSKGNFLRFIRDEELDVVDGLIDIMWKMPLIPGLITFCTFGVGAGLAMTSAGIPYAHVSGILTGAVVTVICVLIIYELQFEARRSGRSFLMFGMTSLVVSYITLPFYLDQLPLWLSIVVHNIGVVSVLFYILYTAYHSKTKYRR
jgi:hypothetical protein